MSQTKPPEVVLFMEKAESIARSYLHPYLGIEHLFWAGLQDGLLDQALISVGSTRQTALQLLRDRLQPEPPSPLEKSLPRTPRLKKVLDRAMKKALAEKQPDLPLSFLFESILEEESGLVALALLDLGTTPSKLLQSFLKPETPPPRPKEKKIKTPLLDKLGRDLTEQAKAGKLDLVIGRTEELRRVMQILTRKTKNVPLLIGEPGVGKTAVVLLLAQRLAKGNVPSALLGKRLVELPLSLLVAGTAHRGELEERVQKLLEELSGNLDCILFIDEIHGIVGAGSLQGKMDVANLLKPALADGSLRVIGATTTEEYQKYLLKDPALERRLQPILVKEPSEEETLKILEGLKPAYEKYHGVSIQDDALYSAVKLSSRYLPNRRLPDKALDLLDEAASRLKTKTGTGLPLVVTSDEIAEITSLWTGIPVHKLTSDEKKRLLNLEERLKSKVIGQDEAIAKLSQTIRVSRAGLGNPKRPIGVFLFLGPTGVGKTELAKALADALFGNPEAMTRLDMSEFKEQHAAAKLIGSPPGYVGYEEEGQLTKAVHAKPYSLILLDEIEKAHPEIFDLFLQIFDDGRLTDSKGRTANFTNTLIIMTSNLGSDQILSCLEKGQREKLEETIANKLKSTFRPEFLNRIDEVILFNPLSKENLQAIVMIQLEELQKRLSEQKLALQTTPELLLHLVQKGFDPAFGARPLRRAVETLLAKPLANQLLQGKFPKDSTVIADFDGEKITFTQGG